MVSRQETARPLLTPGEVMQLPPDDELVLVSGCQPIRAKKARYYEGPELNALILPPPDLSRRAGLATAKHSESASTKHDWTGAAVAATPTATEDPSNSGIRREPELPDHEEIAPEPSRPIREFDAPDEESDDAQRLSAFQRSVRNVARHAGLDPADDMGL
jgi:type IV secretion system protein VirD4